ncbi:transaldolase family protein [Dermatophilaceae bacterium Soc4.6]
MKMLATSVGLHAIEEATYRGVSINVTVSFSVSQAVAAGEAIKRGADSRCTISSPRTRSWTRSSGTSCCLSHDRHGSARRHRHRVTYGHTVATPTREG